jgi:hypothetical protein
MSKFSDKSDLFAYLRPDRTALVGAVMLAGIVSLAGSAQAQTAASAQPELSYRHTTSTVTLHGVVNLGAAPQISAADIAAARKVTLPFRTGVDPVTFAAQKAQAAALRFPMPRGAIAAAPTIPQNSRPSTPAASLVFQDATADSCFADVAADPALAVGAGGGKGVAAVISLNDECINVYDKLGNRIAGPKSVFLFFGVPAPGLPSQRPYLPPPVALEGGRAIYDWIGHRYIIAMTLHIQNAQAASLYAIAVSETDDPNGNYCIYKPPVQSVAPLNGNYPQLDFLRIGQDRQAIYLAANIYNPTFKWEEILVLSKAQLYACQQNVIVHVFGDLEIGGVATDSTQPANTYSAGDQPRSEYLVTSRNINSGGGGCPKACEGLFVWAIHDPVGNPTLSAVSIATANFYSLPPEAVQKGTATKIGTGDTRISGTVVYVGGSLYAALNSNGGGGQPNCILYQIQPFTAASGQIFSARILNEIVFGSGAGSWYYCTQQPDPEGNVTTAFNYSDANTYPTLAYISRRAGQPLGTHPDIGIPAILGAAPYTTGDWGRYTATSIAGLVSGGGTGGFPTMWFSGMYARSDGTWGTAIGRNGYTDLTQP